MILYNNIVKISKNRWIGYMLKVAFLLASSIYKRNKYVLISVIKCVRLAKRTKPIAGFASTHIGCFTNDDTIGHPAIVIHIQSEYFITHNN